MKKHLLTLITSLCLIATVVIQPHSVKASTPSMKSRPMVAFAIAASPNFGFAGTAQVASVDPAGNVSLLLPQTTLYRASDGSINTMDIQTAYFSPSPNGLANARSAMTDAVVLAYAQTYGNQVLARAAAVVPVYQAGQ